MNNRFLTSALSIAMALSASAQTADYKATIYCDGLVEPEQYRSHNSKESISSDENVVYACNGVYLILTGYRLSKTSGFTANPDCRRTGTNSIITATTGSDVLIEDCEFNSHVDKADGLTVTGRGTKAKVQEGEFRFTRANAACVCAVDSGSVTLEETRFTVTGSMNTPFYTDGGTIAATLATGSTTGLSSPLFRTAGTQTAKGCEMTAEKSNIAYIDAGGSLILDGNKLTGNGYCGFQMYSSGQERGFSRLELSKNRLFVTEGPLVCVSNTDAKIVIRDGNQISMKGSDFIVAKADDWGVKGTNGGHADVILEKQSIKGNITADSISSVNLNLKDSRYIGSVNADANPCARISLHLEGSSVWQVSSDSYITSISFDVPLKKGLKMIKGSHTVYYDPDDSDNRMLLGGLEHSFAGGGKLVPNKK